MGLRWRRGHAVGMGINVVVRGILITVRDILRWWTRIVSLRWPLLGLLGIERWRFVSVGRRYVAGVRLWGGD